MTKRTPSIVKSEVDSANAMPDAPRQSSVFNLIHLPSSGSAVMDGDTQMTGTLPDLHPGHIDTSLNGATMFNSQASGPSAIPSMPRLTTTATPKSTFSTFAERSQDRAASITAEPDGLGVTGRGVKDLVQAIDRLRQLGVETSNIPLPKIVVVGDQSAGKSSLIEAISEIKVPRSSGTCTRCPLEIALTADEHPGSTWSCKVYLHKRYNYYGEKFPYQETPSQVYPFKPWADKDEPINELFATVHNKGSLEDVIRRAQFAILNPNVDSTRFISGPIPTNGNYPKPVEFSPNLIHLEISGPRLPNLSFYDLPGIINQTEDSTQPWLVKIVKNLVKEYIKPDNALVLLACSMEVDVHTSSAAKIVRSMGADKRCIGVLTKPDRLPSGEHLELWRSILNGEKFRLGHSYYVTKQPSQADLDAQIDHAQARSKEKAFFDSNEPWATRFAAFRNRFGTPQLQTALSQKLAAQILDSLPGMRFQVHQRMNQIEHELTQLPEPPTADASRIVLEVLQMLCIRISKYMDGEYPYNSFRLRWKAHQQEFCKSITSSMRPTLDPKTSADIAKLHAIKAKVIKANANVTPTKRELPSETIDLDTDSECGTPCPVPYSTPSKKQKVAVTLATPNLRLPQRPTLPQESKFSKKHDLDGIRQVLNDFSASGRPGEIDPKAVDHLILQCLEHWDKPCSTFLKQTEQALREDLMAIMADILGKWKTTGLYEETMKIVEGFLSIHMGHQRDNVAATALQLERAKPITYNEEVLEEYRRKELQCFQDARYEWLATLHFEEMQVNTGKQISTQERTRRTKTDEALKSTLGSDPFQREVEVMAKVRAYYNVAAMRFVDVICQNLQLVLFEQFRSREQFRSNLQMDLEMGLRIHNEEDMPSAQEHCMKLLAEDPAREELRSNLKRERDALNAAQICLDELSLKYQGGESGSTSLSDGTMS